MYWRAFDKAEDLDDKLDVVSRLTELYLQRNQFDRLLTRLQHQDRDDGRRRRTPAVAAARRRRSAWRRRMPPRATWARPAPSSSGCWPPTPATPSSSSSSRSWPRKRATSRARPATRSSSSTWPRATRARAGWRQLYARYGDLEEASGGLVEDGRGQGESSAPHAPGDRQPAAAAEAEPVLEIDRGRCSARTRTTGRRSTARAWPWPISSKTDDAAQAFRALLDADGSPTTRRARSSRPGAATPSSRTRAYRSRRSAARPRSPLEDRIGVAMEIRLPAGSRRPITLAITQGTTWAPADFGQARMAALGWLVSLAERQGAEQGQGARSPRIRKAAEKKPADLQALWDWFYLCAMRFDNAGAYEAARDLSPRHADRPAGLWAYLLQRWAAGSSAWATAITSTQAANRGRQRAAAGTSRARSRAGLLPARSRPGVPSWPRPRSSRTSPTS